MGCLRLRLSCGWLQAKPERLCFFVILLMHRNSYIETTDRRDFGGKPSKWRWARVLSWKIPEFFSVGGARSKNSIFRVLGYPSTIMHTAYKKQFYPKPMVPMETETLKVCFLLIWRVCDQAFGRYRPLKGAKKWWHDHHENRKFAYRHTLKIHWFQKCYSFRSTAKNKEVVVENPFQNSGITRHLWTLGRLELTLVVNTS